MYIRIGKRKIIRMVIKHHDDVAIAISKMMICKYVVATTSIFTSKLAKQTREEDVLAPVSPVTLLCTARMYNFFIQLVPGRY